MSYSKGSYYHLPLHEELPVNSKQLSDWFDPYNQDHMRTYEELCKNGCWPQDFYDIMNSEGVIINENWQFVLCSKMADCWRKHALGK